MRLLLAASCQKDESADIDADGGQPSTEVSPRQLQNRAREIVNSEEYQAFVNQNRSFLSKINSKDFFTEDLIDEENETYNYDVINERLSMTSFESAEEFVQEVEKTYYLTKALVDKYPGLKEASPKFQENMEKESLKRINSLHRDTKGRHEKIQRCYEEERACGNATMSGYVTGQIFCFWWIFSPPAFAYCTVY